MAVAERTFIERQHRLVPPKYGLFSVVEQPGDTDRRWLNGIEYWPPVVPHVEATAIECFGEGTTAGPFEPRDVPEGFPSGDGTPFQVWSGIQCRGMGEDELHARAMTSLQAGEQPFVENGIWSTANPAIMSGDTDVVSSVGLRLDRAIGKLEKWIYPNYASTGVLHLPRELAALADHLSIVSADGATMRTKLGTPVVFGNYPGTGPAGQAATDDAVWIAITGDVSMWRTPMEMLTQNGQAWFDYSTNIGTATAQRDYLVVFDEVAGAALVDLTEG
ncbi:hypothetical protein SEA_VERITY_22 [Gordonia phage Verity]|uniref:Uncharacterized protein n=2 Tax=Zitchvirus TaxID=2948963 RepID=A0A514DIR8_9CAUD|nr:hypothetical protein J1775_gp22 [Gordonia phage Zipp]YP_010002860.1 hypothetical protein J1776_gp22 [Gordonia phage Verity]QPO16865.1 hypothetical protein SEA_DELREY21_22 [Gordonia phage Delrey21]QXN74148.1 hypothetical protein SEA_DOCTORFROGGO_22 [Gordonia phage DoctorFroggo]QDH93176.1 hypothetical protein SEA_ZIPP_22 [Gordonia phage Zipp]QDH93508.1 hypothetical protein SEA_VERITY_22 [Gordonia phage Verity]